MINPDKTLCEIADIITDKILPSAKDTLKQALLLSIIKILLKSKKQSTGSLFNLRNIYMSILRLGTSNRSMTLEEINRYIMSLNIKKPSIIEIEAREQN